MLRRTTPRYGRRTACRRCSERVAMRVVQWLALLVNGLLWRATRQAWFGRPLVEALGEPDETSRSIAGIMLAKAGASALPLLHRALIERRNLPQVLTLLGDVGDASVQQDIARFAHDDDERVARAAQDALRVLALRLAT